MAAGTELLTAQALAWGSDEWWRVSRRERTDYQRKTHEFVPSPLTTNGGRTMMRRICEEAVIDLDGEHDYLTPHGGRRGAGDGLYREDPVIAQTALRHRSIEATKDSYPYIEAGETAS